jgi:hypothetical protein
MSAEREGMTTADRVTRYVAYGLIGLSLLVFVGYFYIYNVYAFALFQFPFDYDQGEGYELVDTILFSQGQWPYRDSNVYPFYSSNYPPVFHLVIVPLVWAFGPHYWTGRLVAYLGTLLTAVVIGYAIHREVGKSYWWLSLLGALTYFASNYVYHVGPLFRQHLFMVMFEVMAVVLLAVVVDREERSGKRNNWGLLGVMILLLLAGYTKQLAYATVAAVFVFLFLRQWKRAIAWAIPFALVTLGIFVWIDWATAGQWWLNTITANLNEFIRDQAIMLYRQWFELHTLITVVAVLVAVYQLYFTRLSAYAVWFVFTAVNSVSAGKWGAGESYFVTAIAASIILTGIGLGGLLRWSKTELWRNPISAHSLLMVLIPILFLWQADKMFHMPTHTPTLRAIAQTLGYPTETIKPPQTSCSAPRDAVAIPYVDKAFISLGRPPTAEDTAGGIAIANKILEGETPAFSEEAGFNLYVGRDVVTNPTQLRNLDLAGALDTGEMVRMLEEQAFDTVVLRAQFFPPAVLHALGQAYETTDLIEMNGFVYCVMRPR